MIGLHDLGPYRHQYRELDNLERTTGRISERIAREVSTLIRASLKRANEESGAYTSEQLEVLTDLLDPEYVRETSDRGYAILMYDMSGPMVVSGMLVNGKNGWELKIVYVDREKKGERASDFVIYLLEEKARSKGAEKLYVEADLFPDTLQFYIRNGFRTMHELRYENEPRLRGQTLEFRVMEKMLR